LVVGLTGGSDDELLRMQQISRLVWLGVRFILLTARLVTPPLMRSLLRRWALDTVALERHHR